MIVIGTLMATGQRPFVNVVVLCICLGSPLPQLARCQISGTAAGDKAALLSFKENWNRCVGPQTTACSPSTTVCTDACTDDLASWTDSWPGPCDRNSDTAHAGWTGVMCGSPLGRVVWLSLGFRGLRGDIASFAPLGMLQHLGVTCDHDAIYGDVGALATLTELRTLVLRSCTGVSGSIRSLRPLSNLGGRYTNVPGDDPWGDPYTGQSGELFLAETGVYGPVAELRAIPGLGSEWGASGTHAEFQFSKCADYSCSSTGLEHVGQAQATAGTDQCACCGDHSQGHDEATGACIADTSDHCTKNIPACPVLLWFENGAAGGLVIIFVVSAALGCCVFCAIMDDHPSGQEAVSTFLMLEFLDVGLDITTLVLTSASGDLEFANDHGGLVQAVLSWSVGFSVLMFCGELIGRKTLLDKVILLTCVHLIFEDLFQALVYTWAAATQAQEDLAWGATGAGAAQAFLFAAAKIVDVVVRQDRG